MKRKGFTLAELMISFLIITLAVVALLSIYFNASLLSEWSRNLMIATQHIESIFEYIRDNVKSQGLSTYYTTIRDNSTNSSYWTNNAIRGDLLEGESIIIDNLVAWNSDPLALNVTVSWVESGRSRSLSAQSQFH